MSTLIGTVKFVLQNTLQGHTKAVNSLCISPDKNRLISIGDDSKVIVWSIASGEKLFEAQRPFYGAATAASWVSRDSSRFVVGFATGDLHLFSSDSGKSYRDNLPVTAGMGAVEGIVYDANYDRLASICAKSTQLWRITGTQLTPILQSPFVSEGYGKSIQFLDNGASVVMYYLDTHECLCYSIDPWEKRWSKRLNTRIGYAAPNHDGQLLLVSNLTNGIDEYKFPSLEKVQTFSHPIEANCILQTRTLPSWNLVVAGGDSGFARVFNRITGQLVSEIHHGECDQHIQAVEAFIDSSNRCVVVTASSYKAPFDLKMWVYEPPKTPPSKESVIAQTAPPSSTWCDRIAIAFIVFLFILLLVLVVVALVAVLSSGYMTGIRMRGL